MLGVAVVGIGAVPVGRYTDKLEHELLVRAFLDAIGDAGVGKSMIDSMIFATPRPYTEQRYFATFMLGYLGLPVTDIVTEVLGNGMTGGLAFDVAAERISSGQSRVALALGVSRELHVSSAEHMTWTMRAVGDVDFHTPLGVTPLAWYAMDATRYLYEYDLDRSDLATIAVKNRDHAVMNPLAHYREPITIEAVLASRPVVRPLHLLDVSPRSDGAVAIVLAEAQFARSLRHDPVYVLSRGFYHEGIHQISAAPRSLVRYESAERASDSAYNAAGIGPKDIDFAEVYAPATIVEAILTESLGFFPAGEGLHAARNGWTRLGGRMPVSTSGGCLSRGHPPHATPLYNVFEVVQQLRGVAGPRQVANARLALTTAELGNYNSTLVHIFGNEPI